MEKDKKVLVHKRKRYVFQEDRTQIRVFPKIDLIGRIFILKNEPYGELSVSALDTPGRSYFGWAKLLFSEHEREFDGGKQGYTITVPRRWIFSLTDDYTIGDKPKASIYVDGEEWDEKPVLDEKHKVGLDLILDASREMLLDTPEKIRDLKNKRIRPEHRTRLFKYFSYDLVSRIKEWYTRGWFRLKLPANMYQKP